MYVVLKKYGIMLVRVRHHMETLQGLQTSIQWGPGSEQTIYRTFIAPTKVI